MHGVDSHLANIELNGYTILENVLESDLVTQGRDDGFHSVWDRIKPRQP